MSSARSLDTSAVLSDVEAAWSRDVLKSLSDYIAIPNQSPAFDPEWETNGHMDRAVDLFVAWIKAQNVPGLTLEVLREAGRTPVLFIEIPGTNGNQETVLLYGHMDKQPPMTEYWNPGTGPHTPVLKDGKLYGRGGADDGYACFAAINAIQAVQKQGLPHARCVILIENCEESGSRDLPYFLEQKKAAVGTPSLVVCLDSGCHNYEQMWMTTSLRGLMMGTLRVDVLTEAVHSGPASGVVPSSFRIIRQLLDRIEDSKTGRLPDVCYAAVPPHDIEYAKQVGNIVGDGVYKKFPWAGATGPVSQDPAELVLGATWMPTLCITGQDGMAPLSNAGNVLRSHTALRLSVRCPPSVEPQEVAKVFEQLLTSNPPYGAKVSFVCDKAQKGWQAPKLAPWLEASLNKASGAFYNKPPCFTGEGGSIPFMGMLSDMYPQAQFVITGVLGPSSNAHGPNEFLHVGMAQRLTGCIAQVLVDHCQACKTTA